MRQIGIESQVFYVDENTKRLAIGSPPLKSIDPDLPF
jgi:hypothetical protein